MNIQAQAIFLKIRKTSTYRRSCTFPGCSNRMHTIRDVPHQFRRNVMKQSKVYIPNGARACNTHLSEHLWRTVDRNITQRNKFTTKQVEDLIELLSASNSKYTYNPGCLFLVKKYSFVL